uniref:Uncharacterized protein n=1 Tax=Anopheles minimus TaxID=112268 RepID=A0A182WMQ0_9DIPT
MRHPNAHYLSSACTGQFYYRLAFAVCCAVVPPDENVHWGVRARISCSPCRHGVCVRPVHTHIYDGGLVESCPLVVTAQLCKNALNLPKTNATAGLKFAHYCAFTRGLFRALCKHGYRAHR